MIGHKKDLRTIYVMVQKHKNFFAPHDSAMLSEEVAPCQAEIFRYVEDRHINHGLELLTVERYEMSFGDLQ